VRHTSKKRVGGSGGGRLPVGPMWRGVGGGVGGGGRGGGMR